MAFISSRKCFLAETALREKAHLSPVATGSRDLNSGVVSFEATADADDAVNPDGLIFTCCPKAEKEIERRRKNGRTGFMMKGVNK